MTNRVLASAVLDLHYLYSNECVPFLKPLLYLSLPCIIPHSILGVPMTRAAAGVACGLLVRTIPGSDEIEKYQILTDIVVRLVTSSLTLW